MIIIRAGVRSLAWRRGGIRLTRAHAGEGGGLEEARAGPHGAPLVAFAPARIKFAAAIREATDDYEEFYCASVQWDWDDGTMSQWTRDCEP